MIEPKTVVIDGKEFILSKFPAIAGREIIAKYPLSGLPKIGDYALNEETMLKLMCYVAVNAGADVPLCLNTAALVDNHAGNWETLGKIEVAMMEYNCSFFRDGRISTFFEDFAQKLPMWISKMLTAISELSSQREKQPSTN